MSVNAVETANVQSKSPLVAPVLGLGLVGATTGAIIGKRPKLEDVFAMEPDSFIKAVENVENEEVKNAANVIGEKINALNGGEFVADSSKLDAEVLKKINETRDEASKIAKLTDASEEELRTCREVVLNDESLKSVVAEFADADKAAKAKKAAKISEYAGTDECKNAFGKIKKLFPKTERGKMALIYGGIAAAAGLFLALAGRSIHKKEA